MDPIVFDIGDVPPPRDLEAVDGISSLPIAPICEELNHIYRYSDSLFLQVGRVLGKIEHAEDRYDICRLILPKQGRHGYFLSKRELVKCLKVYTGVANLKDGHMVNLINEINIDGDEKELVDITIKVLTDYWLDNRICKTQIYKDLEKTREVNNNTVTISRICKLYDDLQFGLIDSKQTENVMTCLKPLLDELYLIIFQNEDLEKQYGSIRLMIYAILGRNFLKTNVIYNSLCYEMRPLGFMIKNARNDLWTTVYSIDKLQKNSKSQDYIRLIKAFNILQDTYKRENGDLNHFRFPLMVPFKVGYPCDVMRCAEGLWGTHKITELISEKNDNGVGFREDIGYCMEEKLDGERLLLHVWRESASEGEETIVTKFFSRNGILQKWYGSFVGDGEGTITKYLSKEMFDGIASVIFDGEVVSYDENEKNVFGFNQVKTTGIKLHEDLKSGLDILHESVYNKYMVFDVLYLNGKSLQNVALKERKALLKESFVNIKSKFIALHQWKTGYNESSLQLEIEKLKERKSEGLVVKKWSSFYYPDNQRSSTWIKFKPHYSKRAVEDLDVLIIGKSPNRSMYNYYVAIKDKDEYFISLCLVVYTAQQVFRHEIEQKTQESWIKFDRKRSIHECLEHRIKFGLDKPDYWIKPEDSLVITISAKNCKNINDAIPERLEFLSSKKLRHPYIERLRDKRFYECDTVEILEERLRMQEDEQGGQSKYRMGKQLRKRKKRSAIEEALNSERRKAKRVKSSLFSKLTFLVLNGCDSLEGVALTKVETESKLEELGGTIINSSSAINPSTIILYNGRGGSVIPFLEKYNILKFTWIEDCIRTKKLVALDESHYYSIVSGQTRNAIGKTVLPNGINWTVNYSPQRLWDVLKSNTIDGSPAITEKIRSKLDYVLYPDRFYLVGYDCSEFSNRKELLTLWINLKGGNVVEEINEADYVVHHPEFDLKREPSLLSSVSVMKEHILLEKLGHSSHEFLEL